MQCTEARTMEPEKCEGWSWVAYRDIPRPVFPPLQKLLDEYQLPPPSAPS
jgi:8-oxo-dGTP diphosphatase